MKRPSSFLRNSIAPWIVVFTIVGYPLVTAASNILDIPNQALSIVARGMVLAIALLCIFYISQTGLHKTNGIFWLAWWIFWFAYLARLFTDHFLNPSSLALPTLEYFLFIFGVSLLPSVAAIYIPTRSFTTNLFDKLVWISTIGLLLNLNHIFSSSVTLESLDTVRAESDVLNPITIGHIGSTILLLAIWKFSRTGSRSAVESVVQFAAVATAATAIIASGSKGPVLALILAILFYAILLPRQFFSIKIIACISVSGILTIVLLQSTPDLFLFTRISEGIFNDEIRSQLLSDAIDLIQMHPVLGSGIEPLGMYPHNLILESFLLFGVFTGVPFLLMIMFVFWKCKIIAKRCPENFWVCLLFAQYFFGGMVSGSLYTSPAFFTLMALIVAIAPERALPMGAASTPVSKVSSAI